MPLLSIEELLRDQVISLKGELAERDQQIAHLKNLNVGLMLRVAELSLRAGDTLPPAPPPPASPEQLEQPRGGNVICLGARIKRRTVFDLAATPGKDPA